MSRLSDTAGMPLYLYEVLEEEYRHLHGPLPADYPTWAFSPDQILAPREIAARLRESGSPLFHRLFQHCHETRMLVEEGPQAGPFDEDLRRTLADDLNRLLRSPDPFEEEWFEVLPPDEETEDLFATPPAEMELSKYNRLLLESAFPGELAKIGDARLAAICERIHALRPGRSALCLSGGGIRSATFSLGVLQGLARFGLLDKLDYLSTVSGGGYIGGLLSGWIHRHPQGVAGVVEDLAASRSPSKLQPEPHPIRFLRTYVNYLSPRLGVLSADTWTLITIVVRNLYLHWLVLLPLLIAVLLLPRLYIHLIQWAPPGTAPLPSWLSWVEGLAPDPYSAPRAIVFLLGSLLIVVSMGYIGWYRPTGGNLPHSQGNFLKNCLLPMAFGAVALTTYWAWMPDRPQDLTVFALLAIALTFVGWLASALFAIDKGLLNHLREILAVIFAGLLGGILLWLAATRLFPDPHANVPLYTCFAVPLVISIYFLGETLYLGLVSRWTDDDDREWWARSAAWMLIFAVNWTAVTLVVIVGPVLLIELPEVLAPIGGIAGAVTAFLSFSPRTIEKPGSEEERTWREILTDWTLGLAAPVFLLFLLAALSLLASWIILQALPPGSDGEVDVISKWLSAVSRCPDCPAVRKHMVATFYAPVRIVALAFVAATALGALMSWLTNINRFSMHSMYRNRLIRTFLGASREDRKPNRFTGFDPKDNFEIRELAEIRRPLFHVVNVTLNLVSGEKLAWQQRKAEPFTFTPLHSGSLRVGYRLSSDYARTESGKAITLGTALAISGAAASPNMGYHSSPAITFLMTFFNARLGWWLGNPGAAGRESYRRSHPLFLIQPLIAEALGLTDDRNSYVYLSDGGHFENLGLYEMVLRRCRFIIVVDAGEDHDCRFEDLANAIRKIRIDFGIPIEFEQLPIYSRAPQGKDGKYCALATIRYSCVDGTPESEDGRILYLKPAVYDYDGEPPDILHYHRLNPRFPHEPTSDQWFSESQFESYRMLGRYTVETVFGRGGDLCGLPALMERAASYLKPPAI